MSARERLTTTVSTKGQIILPKVIRDQLRWEPGTRLVVEDTADGVLLKTAQAFPPTKGEQVFACLPYRGPPKTLDEMNAGVAAEVRRRHARNRY